MSTDERRPGWFLEASGGARITLLADEPDSRELLAAWIARALLDDRVAVEVRSVEVMGFAPRDQT